MTFSETPRVIATGVILALLANPALSQESSQEQQASPADRQDGAVSGVTLADVAPLDGSDEAAQAGELPSLPRLFALALDNESELSRQRYELEATQQEVPKAWSQLKPQLSASGTYTFQESDNYYTDNPDYDPSNEFVDSDSAARYEGQTRDTSWQLSLSQPLFSLERWRGVGQAEAQVEVARLRLAVGEKDLALEVTEAYLDAYMASRKVNLLDSKREALTLQQRQAQRSFDLGVGDRINLLEARSRLDQAVADQVRAENELDNALSDLDRLTGLRPDFDGLALGMLAGVDLEGEEEALDAWLERTEHNLEVRLARREHQAVRSETRVRRAGHYPEVNLNLSYSDRDSNDPFRESQDARASVQLEIPLYQGGFTSANVRQGELRTLASREALTHQRRLARQEVRKRLRNLEGDIRQLDALHRSIESSRLFLEAAEKGEELGLRALVDVLDARAELYDLRIQFVEGARQYLIDDLSLEAAVGDLDTQDLVDAMSLLSRLSGQRVDVAANQQ